MFSPFCQRARLTKRLLTASINSAPKTLVSDLQKAKLRFGLKPFTIEDLQNSVACQMIDNGIDERILYQLLNQEPPEGLPDSDKKTTDRDLRKALEKLEKQLPKSY